LTCWNLAAVIHLERLPVVSPINFWRVVMAQESQNGDHDHSSVRVAVWYDYI
jgi:hypothetical protein